MSTIIQIIRDSQAMGEVCVSLEFFPSLTVEGVNNLVDRILELSNSLRPSFVTLTWRSTFKNEDLWLEIGSTVQNNLGLPILMHLTCHLPKSDIRRILTRLRQANIRNILAIRGDPVIGGEKKAFATFQNAVELVRFIREEHGDYFCIAVAGYPEVHTEAWNNPDDLPPSEQSISSDLTRLKDKIDAGADFVITQFFYDVNKYLVFVDRCRAIGISVPIIPGHLIIQSYKAFKKFTNWCRTSVPHHLTQLVENSRDNDAVVKSVGVDEGITICKHLLQSSPFKCLHFYTMNLAQSVIAILNGLSLTPRLQHRILPWKRPQRPSLVSKLSTTAEGGARGFSEVRPIFWANRQASYEQRKAGWDEFQNGRYSDFRSPAFGELNHYYLEFKRPMVNRREILGELNQESDLHQVFVNYLSGKLSTLPWCETPVSRETSSISRRLIEMNRYGYLTINSQPRANCVKSENQDVGWGNADGFVFQKSYVEFFCNPRHLEKLLLFFPNYPSLTFHAVNCAGATRKNFEGNNPTAVTWGVFPGREIIQPTVVDPLAFMVWKDEAFDLWLSQWAAAYDEGSRSKQIIQNIHDTYYLVNVVNNNYVSEVDALFEMFHNIIISDMTNDGMRSYILDLEGQISRLQQSTSHFQRLQQESLNEIKSIGKQLAESKSNEDALKLQVYELKMQIVMSPLN